MFSIFFKTTKTFEEFVEILPYSVKRKLEQLKFLRERPDFHPEKSAYEHIRIVTERLIQTNDVDLIMAGVFHDICKFDTVRENKKTGWPTSPGHDDAAYDFIVENNTNKLFITNYGGDYIKVALICKYHMRFHQLSVMRDQKRLKQIDEWKKMGIWEKLQFMGAADNMLVDFDINDLEKSFKQL